MNVKNFRWVVAVLLATSLAFFTPTGLQANPNKENQPADPPTTTPIKHVVVIFQENISFDHYFATYPHAENNPGETPFHAKDDTPRVNNLESSGLLTQNNNLDANGHQINPFRIGPSNAVTCDNDHSYNDEQFAFHGGLMDQWLTPLTPLGEAGTVSCVDPNLGPNAAMGYFDGNTVTALWNYAQHFAMSDNSFGTSFGPSTPGALNLIAGTIFGGQLFPTTPNGNPANPAGLLAGGSANASTVMGSVIGDARPHLDDCVSTTPKLRGDSTVTVNGTNIGDLLNANGITWGWFQGGFAPTGLSGGLAVCGQHHTGLAGDDATTQSSEGDYIPHHEPFQYFASTANPHHSRPSDASKIGTSGDGTNHQYDITDFFTALDEGRLPAVSFLKAPAYQDGHPGYSDPIDEQFFVVNTINAIEQTDKWKSTLIIIAYDDSDGWYDHQMGPIIRQSDSPDDDELVPPGNCGVAKAFETGGTIQNGRCGLGPRQPFIVISAFAKQNYVDHRVTEQASIIRFIEDNWKLGRLGNGSADATAGTINGMLDFDDRHHASKLILDPTTGQVIKNAD